MVNSSLPLSLSLSHKGRGDLVFRAYGEVNSPAPTRGKDREEVRIAPSYPAPCPSPARGEGTWSARHGGEADSAAQGEEALFWLVPLDSQWWACPWCGKRDNVSWAAGCPECGYRKYNPWGYLLRPVETATVTGGFTGRHKALDFGSPEGSPVFAAADGIVVEARKDRWAGNIVRIEHANGLQTVYGHLREIGVPAGRPVRMGEVIARSGSTGVSTGPHLHFEVLNGGGQVDPLQYLGPIPPLPFNPE